MIKRLAIIVLAAIMLLGVFGLSGCKDDATRARERIAYLTEVEIPAEAECLFHHVDNVFVNGRRAGYSVFDFKERPSDFLAEYGFQEGRDLENERYFSDSFYRLGFMKLKIEDIPNEYLPVFQNEYLWLRTRGVYFFFFAGTKRLMIFVDGT